MTFSISTEELPGQPMLSLRRQTSPEQLGQTLAEMLPAVFAYIQQQGQVPAGQPFTIYHQVSGEELDVEAGLPLAQPLQGEQDIRAGSLFQGNVATTIHQGPYDQLHLAHEALRNWVAAEGKSPAGPLFEIYITDPGTVADPNLWQTKVCLPLQTA